MMNKTPLEVEEKPDNHCCDTRNVVAYLWCHAVLSIASLDLNTSVNGHNDSCIN